MQSKVEKIFAVRFDGNDLEWLKGHKNPAEYLRTLVKKARFPKKVKEQEKEAILEYLESWYFECPFLKAFIKIVQDHPELIKKKIE